MPRFPRVLPAPAVIALVTLAACGDPYEITASRETVARAFSVYALNGTPVSVPTALLTTPQAPLTPVRAEAGIGFDLAFDLDAQNRPVVYTSRWVLGENAAQLVGLRVMDVPFDSVHRAPSGGYAYDSLLTAPPGTVFVVQAQRSRDCIAGIERSEFIYSKIQVDSVRIADRLIFMHGVSDPSCGFRSFLPGLPES